MKADLITGGGFDLEKSKKMKAQTIEKKPPQIQKQPLKKPKK